MKQVYRYSVHVRVHVHACAYACVRPPPHTHTHTSTHTLSPGLMSPPRTASSSASGMEAALVLP